MIGALVGIKQIPQNMVFKLIKFDCENCSVGVKRPEYLSTRKHLLKNIQQLIKIRPIKTLKIEKIIYEKKKRTT